MRGWQARAAGGHAKRRQPGDPATHEQPEGYHDLQNADTGRRHTGENQPRRLAQRRLLCVEQCVGVEMQILGRVLPKRGLQHEQTGAADGKRQRNMREPELHLQPTVAKCVAAPAAPPDRCQFRGHSTRFARHKGSLRGRNRG